MSLIQFLFHLALYSVLLVGLVAIAGHTYRLLRRAKNLCMDDHAKASVGTGALMFFLLCLMAFGTPSVYSVGGIIVLLVFAGVIATGAYYCYRGLEPARAWFAQTFGSHSDCGC